MAEQQLAGIVAYLEADAQDRQLRREPEDRRSVKNRLHIGRDCEVRKRREAGVATIQESQSEN